MPKRLTTSHFGILVGLALSVLIAAVLILAFVRSPRQSPSLMQILLLPALLSVAFSTALLWLRTHQRTASIRRTRRGQCPKCEYDLAGNTTGICPECGSPTPTELRHKPINANHSPEQRGIPRKEQAQ